MDALALALSVVNANQASAGSDSDNSLVVSADLGARPQVSRHIFGLFLEHLGRCIYDGVADANGCLREEVVAALAELRVPNLRWPGGCFADGYHWRDGVGPPEQRRRTVNQHWGGDVESNSFGSHEFMALCEAVGAEPYVVGNLGSGGATTARQARRPRLTRLPPWCRGARDGGLARVPHLRRRQQPRARARRQRAR